MNTVSHHNMTILLSWSDPSKEVYTRASDHHAVPRRAVMLWSWEGNCGPSRKQWQPTVGSM